MEKMEVPFIVVHEVWVVNDHSICLANWWVGFDEIEPCGANFNPFFWGVYCPVSFREPWPPKPMNNWRLKPPHIWLMTLKHAGNVGSHGRNWEIFVAPKNDVTIPMSKWQADEARDLWRGVFITISHVHGTFLAERSSHFTSSTSRLVVDG